MIYNHSKTSILCFTFTESCGKGNPTVDLFALGNHAVTKLGSVQGQEFASFWKVINGNEIFFLKIFT